MQIQPTPILLATDQNGSVLYQAANGLNRQIAYAPFGHRSPRPARSESGFNGQIQEIAQDVYLLGSGYRAFSTVTRRFHRPDESSPFGAGGINAYVYCAGDPINYTDPKGRWKIFGWLRRTARSGTPEVLNARSFSSLATETSTLPSSPPSYSASQALHANGTSLQPPLQAPPPYSQGASAKVFFSPSAKQISDLVNVERLQKIISTYRTTGRNVKKPTKLMKKIQTRLPAQLQSPPPYAPPERLIFFREAPPAHPVARAASNVRSN